MARVSPPPFTGPRAFTWNVADLDGAGTRQPAVTIALPSGLYLASVMFQFESTGADLTGCGLDAPADWTVVAGGLGPGPVLGLTSYSWVGIGVVEVEAGSWDTEVWALTDGGGGTVDAVGGLTFTPARAGA